VQRDAAQVVRPRIAGAQRDARVDVGEALAGLLQESARVSIARWKQGSSPLQFVIERRARRGCAAPGKDKCARKNLHLAME
jgi:hypothetical protein